MSKYNTQLQAFAISLLVIELIVLFLFGFFVRNETDLATNHLDAYYPWFQDVNVMILVGFGFLMTFIRSKGWSALGFTFFINAVIFQLYILWEGFWHKVFHNHFGELEIKITIVTLIKCSFAVASVLISFGAIIGRVSPL
jgi:ammonium transporter Rh